MTTFSKFGPNADVASIWKSTAGDPLKFKSETNNTNRYEQKKMILDKFGDQLGYPYITQKFEHKNISVTH